MSVTLIPQIPQQRQLSRIAVSALNLTAGDAPRVDGLSVNIERDAMTAFVGGPTSGADVLVSCLAGLTPLEAGHAMVNGRRVTPLAGGPLTGVRTLTGPDGAVTFAVCPLIEDFAAMLDHHRTEALGTLIVATRDPEVATRADRVLVMSRGHLIDDLR